MPTHLAVMDVSPNKRGSFENYTVRLTTRLSAAGWRTVQAFWGQPPRWLENELRQAGAEIVVLSAQPELAGFVGRIGPLGDAPGLDRQWRLAKLLRRIVHTVEPDIVHLHFCVLFSLLPFAVRAGGARTILATEHISLPFARRSLPRDLIVRARNAGCMQLIERILPVSEYVRRRLLESDHVPPGKATTLYNGIDLTRFQPPSESRAAIRRRLGVPPDVPVVSAVGQLIQVKGFHHLVDAAHRLGDRAIFLIVGDGSEQPALAEQIARLGIGERVRLLGKRDDVHEILGASDLFVCPSVWDEALGYVILEAMAVGLPAVASRVGGIPEVVAEG
ncbi:MAG TPA: glycosyltransferase family 4 protein, partial [Candidatus Udaeobacter sp.]|nr:glycosyltransferase family 4 protein [Candidatus Udaeobacter sp.]